MRPGTSCCRSTGHSCPLAARWRLEDCASMCCVPPTTTKCLNFASLVLGSSTSNPSEFPKHPGNLAVEQLNTLQVGCAGNAAISLFMLERVCSPNHACALGVLMLGVTRVGSFRRSGVLVRTLGLEIDGSLGVPCDPVTFSLGRVRISSRERSPQWACDVLAQAQCAL